MNIRDALLHEYYYRCAVCGGDRPRVYHIDEDHSNNELDNLLPLCPNCHLRDQHNPARRIDIQKLILFRKYKDPAILKPQFHPLYIRQIFLTEVELNDEPTDSLEQQANELVDFVSFLEMGSFYSKRIKELMAPVNRQYGSHLLDYQDPSYEEFIKSYNQQYREELFKNQEEIQKLIVELLRYQAWANI